MNHLMKAHSELRAELIAALQTDPARVVMTPGFGNPTTAVEVIADDFAGDDTRLLTLLQILGRASRGEDVRTAAELWISVAAERHATFHRQDLVQRDMESA